MDVYVLFIDANDNPVTVHATLEGAMAASPGEWVADVDGVWLRDGDMIFETPVQP